MKLKKLKFMVLLILLVLLSITIISYEVYAEEVSFIEDSEEYIISLSYDHGGLVKVLEIDGFWIRCEIV